ncbi:hypothetical protein GCM10010415_37330 [Streptomyces atrovirens]|uniref:Uncharacterized protein n=1 Tax=Streptomyces atrovirens TaxID=285556 RepID=A0ABW0DK67_9ACTN
MSLAPKSDERPGKPFVRESGSTSLLFVGSRTEYTWQDQQVITSEDDLPRIPAPPIELVQGSADQG